MHPLLKRQLKRIGADAETPPDSAAWAMLLERVSAAYREGEDERYLLERSLEISSHEMRELYEARARSEERQARGEQEHRRQADAGKGAHGTPGSGADQ